MNRRTLLQTIGATAVRLAAWAVPVTAVAATVEPRRVEYVLVAADRYVYGYTVAFNLPDLIANCDSPDAVYVMAHYTDGDSVDIPRADITRPKYTAEGARAKIIKTVNLNRSANARGELMIRPSSDIVREWEAIAEFGPSDEQVDRAVREWDAEWLSPSELAAYEREHIRRT